jgi:hypothetical protein
MADDLTQDIVRSGPLSDARQSHKDLFGVETDPAKLRPDPYVESRKKTPRDYLIDVFRGLGAGNYRSGKLAGQVEDTANLLPIIGQGLAARRSGKAFKKGDYGEAALEGVGALPGFIGPAGRSGMGALKLVNQGSGRPTWLFTKDKRPFATANISPGGGTTVQSLFDPKALRQPFSTGPDDPDLLRLLGLNPLLPTDPGGVIPSSLSAAQTRRILSSIVRDPELSHLDKIHYQRVTGARKKHARASELGTPQTDVMPIAPLRTRAEKQGIPPPKEMIVPDKFLYDKPLPSRKKLLRAERARMGRNEIDDDLIDFGIDALPEPGAVIEDMSNEAFNRLIPTRHQSNASSAILRHVGTTGRGQTADSPIRLGIEADGTITDKGTGQVVWEPPLQEPSVPAENFFD